MGCYAYPFHYTLQQGLPGREQIILIVIGLIVAQNREKFKVLLTAVERSFTMLPSDQWFHRSWTKPFKINMDFEAPLSHDCYFQ